MIRSLQTRLKPLLPRTRSAYWVYGLALPLFVIGFILVGVGTLETLQDSSPEIADQPLVIETASSVIEEVEYSSGEISAVMVQICGEFKDWARIFSRVNLSQGRRMPSCTPLS
jgi:hypothetical protein